MFASKKTVRSAADLLAAVERALVLNAMQKVTHDRRVIGPALRRSRDIVVAMQESDPVPFRVASNT